MFDDPAVQRFPEFQADLSALIPRSLRIEGADSADPKRQVAVQRYEFSASRHIATIAGKVGQVHLRRLAEADAFAEYFHGARPGLRRIALSCSTPMDPMHVIPVSMPSRLCDSVKNISGCRHGFVHQFRDEILAPLDDVVVANCLDQRFPPPDALLFWHDERKVDVVGQVVRAVRIDEQGILQLLGGTGKARKDEDARIFGILGRDVFLGD